MKDFLNNVHEAKFLAIMNINYHTKSEGGLQRFYYVSVFLTILLSSATILSFCELNPSALKDYRPIVGISCALIVTILNGILVAFRVTDRIYNHRDLKREWYRISTKIANLEMPEQHDDLNAAKDKLKSIRLDMTKINENEPPPNKRRLLWAHKKTVEQLGLSQA